MPGILWSTEEREREWAFAKEKLMPHGKLLPNESKLRRKDYPDNVNHSFMVIDDRIIALSGKGVHLGSGRDAHTKLAEDEARNLIALKIVTRDGGESNSVRESHIAHDLGIAGQRITRTSTSKSVPTKHYIAYQYLGTRLLDYIRTKPLSLDKCYELCIKISLALHEIHTGKKTKSKKSYQHNDIHWGNLLIDEQEEPHFIDYGRAWEAYGKNKNDIVQMLLLFFTPIKDRNYRHDNWIFGNWMGEYEFSYDKPRFSEQYQQYVDNKNTIYIYVDPSDKIEGGFYPQVRYMVRDSENVFQKGVIDLRGLGLTQLPHIKEDEVEDETFWHLSLSDDDLSHIEDKVLEVANQNNHTISRTNRNETLFNLLKDPTAFYRTPKVPTALDIAETLTLCRLQLETYQDLLTTQSPDVRLEIIQILNSVSSELIRLYEQLHALPSKDSLDKLVKNYIFSHLVSSPKEISEDSLDFLNLQLDETHTIKQRVDNILINILHAKETWRAKNTPISQDESDQRLQPKLPDSIEVEAPSKEVISPVVIKLEIDELVTVVNHDSPEPQEPISVIHDELDRVSANQTPIVNETGIAPTIISHESTEFIVQEDQNHIEHTIPQAERDFLRELKNLQDTIEEQQNLASKPPLLTLKQQRARKAALDEASRVVNELQKQLPLAENEERLQSLHHSEVLLIRLADICSHTAQGLHFVAKGGASFSCDIFDATNNTSGTICQVNYDINMHQSGMEHLSKMASSLEGSGWKKLRNSLFALAGLMLIACGILAAIPTGGTSLLLGLGGAAVLTAGVGFFVGRDTGLAGAVGSVQMNVSP